MGCDEYKFDPVNRIQALRELIYAVMGAYNQVDMD
jgi:hypothetical protein